MQELTQEEVRLLEHIRCFRITTREYAQKLCSFATIEQTEAALRNLRANGLLLVGQLFADRLCYSLARSGFEFFQMNPNDQKAISPKSLIESYGILAFCAGAPKRHKLTREMFLQTFGQLALRGAVQANYYLDANYPEPKLGFVAVDRGKDIHREIYHVELKVLRRRAQASEWKPFLSADSPNFVIAFVTLSKWKADKFAEYYQRTMPFLPVQTQIVPELFRILNRL